jgi:hypothetical protein
MLNRGSSQPEIGVGDIEKECRGIIALYELQLVSLILIYGVFPKTFPASPALPVSDTVTPHKHTL